MAVTKTYSIEDSGVNTSKTGERTLNLTLQEIVPPGPNGMQMLGMQSTHSFKIAKDEDVTGFAADSGNVVTCAFSVGKPPS